MNASKLSEIMAEHASFVAEYLFPNGQRTGKEWRVGSLAGEEGQSLGVSIAGNKAGLWCDFATGESGDLLDLWMKAKGCALQDAMGQACKLLNIQVEHFGFVGSLPEYDAPVRVKCSNPKAETPVAKYLIGRGLTIETLNAFRIGDGGDIIVFPFFHDGEVKMIKRLMLERKNGRKDIRPTSGNQMPCLFGWQAIDPKTRTVTICEGEIDAMSLKQIGVNALSVPFGGGPGNKQDWIQNEFDNLAVYDTIYLCLDDDDEGRKGVGEIAERLGRHRCRVVTLGHKDANEALLAGMDIFDLTAKLNDSVSLDPEELRSARDYCDEVVREFYPPENQRQGFLMPWSKVGDEFLFRPGEVTIVAGYNGHGKTQLVGHLMVDAISQGEKSCMASLEFKPRKMLRRLARQVSGTDLPDRDKIKEVHSWYSGKLWIYDYCGVANAETLLRVFEYACKKYGVTLFVIDNLSKLNISMERADEQAVFVNKLMSFAKDYDVHVLLVAHMRKGEHEIRVGGKMDVKGSGAITDLPDSCLICWRNKKKEEQRREGKHVDETEADALCQCTKQREGDHEPKVKLWFNVPSYQFLGQQGDRPIDYLKVK